MNGKAGIDDLVNKTMPDGIITGRKELVSYQKNGVENFEDTTFLPAEVFLRKSSNFVTGNKASTALKRGILGINNIINTSAGKVNKVVTKENEALLNENKIYSFSDASKIGIKNSTGINRLTGKPFTKQEIIDLKAFNRTKTNSNEAKNIKEIKSIQRGEKLFLDLTRAAYNNNPSSIQFISEMLYNSDLNSNTGRNAAPVLGKEEGVKDGSKTEEHTYQANNWARRTIQAITSSQKVLDGWYNWSKDNYYQITITKDADGRLNKSYNINGKIYSSSSKEFPLIKEALDLAFKTGDFSNVPNSAIRMFHPFTYKEGGLNKTVDINPNITTLNGKTYAEIYNVVVPA